MKKPLRRIISAIVAISAVASSLCLCTVSAVVTPNPVISRNCPAYSQSGNASSANDEHYFSFASIAVNDYLAYDLSAVPDSEKKQVIAVWYSMSSFDKIGMYANTNMIPSDYTVEVNKADGGEYPESGWEVVETVTENTLASHQHLVNMEGFNWIRLNVTGAIGNSASINFDVHNVSDGISDSWLFLGDSITAGGMNNCFGTGFATHINSIDERFFPIQENGGIGGIRSIDGRENIDRWLSVSQAKYVSIAYGTNDCWGNPNATQEYYENTKYMIDAIIKAGKIPVLPKIPASTNDEVKDNVPLYNEIVEKIYEEYGDKIIRGVDFEEFFTEHPDYLSGDGVHPNDTGYAEMRKVWAETMYERVYSAETPDKPTKYGDLTYKKHDDYIEIVSCDKSAVSVEIPSEIENLPVTVIGDGAFSECKNIESVKISEGLKTIEYGAFSGCVNLEKIVIPKSVEKIGGTAFAYAEYLSITILNPECELEDLFVGKLSMETPPQEGMTTLTFPYGKIYGYKGSTAEAYAEKYMCKFFEIEENEEGGVCGDANGDGAVNIADATAIVQFIGNPDSYPLTEKQLRDADCYNRGDGVTPMDAYAVQLLEAGSIKSLPYKG